MVENLECAWKFKILQLDNNIDGSWIFHAVLRISSIKSLWAVKKKQKILAHGSQGACWKVTGQLPTAR